ncbi:hypothetical protein [Pedococcus bigeumensis]|uniref:hypothetical protein n=1 Tax=Pedococcus bigeumensis TaxID=433644 RepID=UPI002FE79F8D
MVPEVVRLKEAGVCGCGQVVAAGERAGWARRARRVVCLSCLAGFSTPPEEDGSTMYYEAPVDGDDEAQLLGLPEPVAVVIPADWGPSAPSSLPSWQRSAGITVDLPAAAPVSPAAADPAGPSVVVQFTPPAPVDEDAGPTSCPTPAVDVTTARPPAPAEDVTTEPPTAPAVEVVADASVVAVSHEAVAIVGPSHRRRTFLPAGLLALRASRGREPGVTGLPDGATRTILDAAADAGVLSLHDRRMPGRRARIAHLAVGASGVYVIDVVRAKNASVEVRPVDDPAPLARELVVGGRPMTPTVTATKGRVDIVRGLLDEVGLSAVPVVGVLCFVDAAVPSEGGLEVEGVRVTGKDGLSALVRSEGALDADHLETLVEYLSERLPVD